MIAKLDPRECPYVGLEPFEAAHARYFFGRRQDSHVLADHVRTRSVVVLYGASGIGKSSVLNVGLPEALPKSWSGEYLRKDRGLRRKAIPPGARARRRRDKLRSCIRLCGAAIPCIRIAA